MHVRFGSWPKNTFAKAVGENRGPCSVSDPDRRDQRLDSNDVHDPCQIVGEHREGHLGGYFWNRFGEKVRRSHAGLERTKCSTVSRRWRIALPPARSPRTPSRPNRSTRQTRRSHERGCSHDKSSRHSGTRDQVHHTLRRPRMRSSGPDQRSHWKC